MLKNTQWFHGLAWAGLLLIVVGSAGAASRRIDLARLRPTPKPSTDPYFGFQPPSKNPADYESDMSPGDTRRMGVESMGPSIIRTQETTANGLVPHNPYVAPGLYQRPAPQVPVSIPMVSAPAFR
jgi:hypothetical protein